MFALCVLYINRTLLTSSPVFSQNYNCKIPCFLVFRNKNPSKQSQTLQAERKEEKHPAGCHEQRDVQGNIEQESQMLVDTSTKHF